MKTLLFITLTICIISCATKEEENIYHGEIVKLLDELSTDSLDIQKILGEEYYHTSYKIKNGKILLGGGYQKFRTKEEDTSLIFVIDIANKKLISKIVDPVNRYIDRVYDLVNDSTLLVMHILDNEYVYLIDIATNKTEKKYIRFNETANRPASIDANGSQLLMTQNVYGFAIADLNNLKGEVFVNSSFYIPHSTVSYPIDADLNLLSGTKIYDSIREKRVTGYAIDKAGEVKWEKSIPDNKQEISSVSLRFFNLLNRFIVKYNNRVESWNRDAGWQIWQFTTKTPIEDAYMVGDKLVTYEYYALEDINGPDYAFRLMTESERKKIKYHEEFNIIDLHTGEKLWSKRLDAPILDDNLYSTPTKYGVVDDKLVLINHYEKSVIDINTLEEQKVHSDIGYGYWGFDTIMDSKTGDLYLEYENVLYW